MEKIPKEKDYSGYGELYSEKLYKEACEEWMKKAKEERIALESSVIDLVNRNRELKRELKLFKKLENEEIYPLTEYLSEHPRFIALKWGGSSIVVALKLLKLYDKLALWVTEKHINGPEITVLLKELGYLKK